MLGMSETNVIHLALVQLVAQIRPAYEADDGPLSSWQIAAVHEAARPFLPTGTTLSEKSLF